MVLAIAVLAGGCLAIDGTTSSQAPLGDVRLEFRICADGAPDCPEDRRSPGGPVQVLVGILLPDGVDPAGPPQFLDRPEVAAAFDQGYTDRLNGGPEPPPGQRWLGYLTSPIDASGDSAALDSRVRVTVPLPPGTGGAPYAGPLAWGAAVGYRVVDEARPASRPVDCDAVPPSGTQDLEAIIVGRDTECVTASVRDLAAATIDLALTAGAGASGLTGETIPVPFRALQNAGAQPVEVTYTLSATTDLPGGSASPEPGAIVVRGDGATEPIVAVTIPEGTAPGTYRAELTATADGLTRTATGMFTVLPAPPPPPPAGPSGTPSPTPPPPPASTCEQGPLLPTLGPWMAKPDREYPGYRLVKTGPKNPVGHGGWLAVDACFRPADGA